MRIGGLFIWYACHARHTPDVSTPALADTDTTQARGGDPATRGASASGRASMRGGTRARQVEVVDSGNDSEDDEEEEGNQDVGM